MICFRDRTFCNFCVICKWGYECDRALTQDVKDAAEKWWGGEGAPICTYAEFPKCFVEFIEGGEDDRHK